jgi:hypothetical protein
MGDHVDFLFLCTAHRVHERAVLRVLDILLKVGPSPCSVESIAEKASYSVMHTHRVLKVLTWQDQKRGISPVIMREGGRRGIPHRYTTNRQRAFALGLIDAA